MENRNKIILSKQILTYSAGVLCLPVQLKNIFFLKMERGPEVRVNGRPLQKAERKDD